MNSFLRIRIGIAGIFLFLLCGIMLSDSQANAASLTAKGKLVTLTSAQISIKASKDVTHWRIIRMIEKGNKTKRNIVKTLNASKKSFTIKKLKKNDLYHYEIEGCKKTKGKLKGIIYDYVSFETGVPSPVWDVYTYTDDYCGPDRIDVSGSAEGDGWPTKGIVLYRRTDGEEEFEKVKTYKKLGFTYKDKNVTAGGSYDYKMRAWGMYKGKKIWSDYSSVMCRSAVNKYPGFTSTLISRDKHELIIKLDSEKYNGALTLGEFPLVLCKSDVDSEDSSDEIDLEDSLDEGGFAVYLTQYGKDGVSFTSLDLDKKETILLCGGESLYLKFENSDEKADLTDGDMLGTEEINYNGWPCFFYTLLSGKGQAWQDMESIH